MTREIFAKTLQDIVRESGIRQVVIAQALGLSAAAVSQFIHGITLPKLNQLNALLDLLCVPDKLRVKLCRELKNLRDKDPDKTADEEPMEQDDAENDCDCYDLETLYSGRDQRDSIMLSASEFSGVPVISLGDLDELPPGVAIFEFACQYLQDTVIRNFGISCSPVMIKAAGDQLGINLYGMVQVTVADDVQLTSSSLVLARYAGSKYRIVPYSRKESVRENGKLFNECEPVSGEPEWMIPVLELSILPAADDLSD